MTGENKVFVSVLVVIALGVGWLFMSGGKSNDSQPSIISSTDTVGLNVGQQAPTFSFTTIEGRQLTSEMLRGQIVVLTTSAAWCPTCVIEAQQFAPVYEKYKDEPVAFVTIDIDPNMTIEQIDQFRRDNNTPWEYVQAAGAGQWVRDYKIDRFEITYVIDQQGIVRFKDKEITASADLGEAIRQLL